MDVDPTNNEMAREEYVEQRNSRRAKTLSVRQLRHEMKQLRRAGSVERVNDVPSRPKVRSECERGARPCPFVSCKFHLYLDVTPSGSMKLNFPEKEPWELTETCSLDVTDRGGVTLEEVGIAMNLTRERVRQLEMKALRKILNLAREDADRDRRRLPLIDEETIEVLNEVSPLAPIDRV